MLNGDRCGMMGFDTIYGVVVIIFCFVFYKIYFFFSRRILFFSRKIEEFSKEYNYYL